MAFKFAPLNGAFMASSMLGGMISLMYVIPKSFDWGVTFTIVFAVMFIASLVSMSVANPDDFVELEEKPRKSKK